MSLSKTALRKMTSLSGKIQTVTGCINQEDLGVTLTHEHLAMTFEVAFTPPQPQEASNTSLPITMPNLGWIRQNPYSHSENLMLNQEQEAIIDEMIYFKKNGGCSIVDNSLQDINRDVVFLRRLAKTTGINIVAGTGHYVSPSHPADMNAKSTEAIANHMVSEIITGCGTTDIKCGIIGELGCSWPLEANERKVLRAAAAAQTQLMCPVIIHPGRSRAAPEEIIRVLQEAGGNIDKTVMSHLDRSILDEGELLEFAKMGSYLEYDLFGIETSHYQLLESVDMPSDAQRIQKLRLLAKEGYGDKLLVAHDIHTKHRLMKYGGHGYSHILLNIVPKMKQRGFSQDEIDTILISNPRSWLTFN